MYPKVRAIIQFRGRSKDALLGGVGESAAETIVDQIEKQNGARMTTIHAKVPSAFFSAANLMADSARESA